MTKHLLLLVLAIAGCGGGGYVVDGTQELFLLTNLRPNARGVMTSVLQWRGASVLPVCTPVQIGGVNAREIRFRDRSTGQVYRYLLHRSSRSPIEEHVNRYFGPQCPNLAAYSPIDQQGIQSGQVLPGMSKEGVIRAAGYPPEHETPSLEAPTWTYWGDRGRLQVQFSGDVVAAVGDPRAQPQPDVYVEPQPEPQPAGPPVIGPDGYPVSQAPVQGGATVTVQGGGGYPQQQPSATVQVQAAPASATVTVQTERPSRRARRRRRARVGVAVGGTVVAGAAATHQPRQRTVTRRRSTTRTSGCSSLTINGSVYTDHPNTPMGQSCDGGGCPASYVCVMPLGVCVPDDGQRCHQ